MHRLAVAVAVASVAAVSLLSAQQGAARGPAPAAKAPAAKAAAGPVMVIETVKGTIEVQLFESEAPKSVAHILELVKRNFYRSQRFHRVEASLVQFGDQLSRDMTQEKYWGTGGGYNAIGVAEISKTRKNVRGTVGLANAGAPAQADSQIYIMKAASPSLDGKYAIIGQVTSGITVVDKIEKADMIKLVSIK